MLSRHPGIEKISLTGETGTGRAVMADAAATLKHVTMELGGKSPLLVFDDAKFGQRGDRRAGGKFLHSRAKSAPTARGCFCIKRLKKNSRGGCWSAPPA